MNPSMASKPLLNLHTLVAELLLCLVLVLDICSVGAHARLSLDYYKSSCPRMEEIVRETVINKQIASPTTAGAALRLFFHDCFVEGCDASVLISSTPGHKAERDADINLSLPGDGFDVVVRAKAALELDCPGVVSCADILALATRNLVRMAGGPYYSVQLGRKDGVVSSADRVGTTNIPTAKMPMSQMISLFAQKGFTVQEMVALSGAHTIGFSHCKEFAFRIYNYGPGHATDPSLNSAFAQALQKACANYLKDPTMSVFNDMMTPGKFDNRYYQNLPRGLGILPSDSALYSDSRTRPFVLLYAANQTTFFDAFARAMEKLSVYQVKTGFGGEIRARCDTLNF